jgi:vitamin B12 transporter
VLGPISAGAQDRTNAADEIVVVTATKIKRKLNETGSSVTVISADEIKRKGAVFVTDVLRDVPGVSVTQTGGPGGQAAVRLRGEEGYRTLLLLDGMKLSDPSGTQVLMNFADLLARDIEKIEILRGPQALLYGADAIGGVISITTKRGQAGTQMGASFEAGSFGVRQGTMSFRGSEGIADWSLGASGFDNQGISAQPGIEPDPYTNATLHGVLGFSLSENSRLEVVLRYTDAEAQFDRFDFALLTSDTDNVLFTQQFASRLALNLNDLGGGISLSLAAIYLNQSRADYSNGAPFIFGSRFDSERTRLEALGRWEIATGQDIVLGADFEDEAATTDSLAKGRTIIGAFAEYQGRLTQNTFLTAGLRHDAHEQFGEHLSWRATLAHRIELSGELDLTARASAGTGFRAPSLFELFDGFSGDPTLQEEKAAGWDLGLEFDWRQQGVNIAVTYFQQTVEDEIRFDPNLFIYVQNLSDTHSWGVETSASARLFDSLRMSAAYTYNEATVGSLDAENGFARPRRPRHLGSVSLDYAFDEARGNLNATLQTAAKHQDGFFTFRSNLDGRAVFNLAARYRLEDWLTVTLRGQNIFDERYEEASGYNASRAGVFAGMELEL